MDQKADSLSPLKQQTPTNPLECGQSWKQEDDHVAEKN